MSQNTASMICISKDLLKELYSKIEEQQEQIDFRKSQIIDLINTLDDKEDEIQELTEELEQTRMDLHHAELELNEEYDDDEPATPSQGNDEPATPSQGN
jgi:chromosome segregation ATPase